MNNSYVTTIMGIITTVFFVSFPPFQSPCPPDSDPFFVDWLVSYITLVNNWICNSKIVCAQPLNPKTHTLLHCFKFTNCTAFL